ncbi:hypothetical protein M422DRAFT_29647 [Sphaerobolus stellatus SS14]|uniref:ferric-chelate reductase (NADPH) n=1 Tax=Sphaerobolus stellatus (strain SS14) TaxID=990650 RepID=A0A0C9W360_SPHS4|nr:hypothetical protein M422DRAFT_29647 [Sphaerobolus stellatus SS14]
MSNDPGSPFFDPNFVIYNSYETDPKYQRTFTIAWTAGIALAICAAAPRLFRSIKNGRAWQGWGIWENVYGSAYNPVQLPEKIVSRPTNQTPRAWLSMVQKYSLWRIPYINLDIGQLVILSGYYAAVVVCIFLHSPIVQSPNRAGFLAIAQLPAVFLFGTKNNVLGLLLGKGYEKLNYLHRWSGRIMFFSATIHGSLWLYNNGLGNVELDGSNKITLGIAAYSMLCLIVITSLPFVRKAAYQFFFALHMIGYVSFFVVICYHTLYAVPWIFPPLAFYGLDLLLRMIRTRIKDAVLVPVDNQMTLIHVENCDGGWIAGQHVQLRVFFSARMFESHPFTILNAPSPTSCTSSGELILAARVSGDWTKALNEAARHSEKSSRVAVMIDGPYGGSTIDLGEYENVLLVAGGSGVTFALGLLDDIVGRVINMKRTRGERTKRIQFTWCIRSFGAINWMASMLNDIATKAQDSSIDLHIKIFVTCLCDPEAVPTIPNSEVTIEKPKITNLISPFLSAKGGIETGKSGQGGGTGGLAVVVSGPRRLTFEAQNVIAQVPASTTRRIGGIALHTEVFSL